MQLGSMVSSLSCLLAWTQKLMALYKNAWLKIRTTGLALLKFWLCSETSAHCHWWYKTPRTNEAEFLLKASRERVLATFRVPS